VGFVDLRMKFTEVFTLLYLFCLPLASAKCKLKDKCRLVDVNASDKWLTDAEGRYRSIQACVNDAEFGDTCMLKSGSYHEEIEIDEKHNLTIRSENSRQPATLDGTIVLRPKDNGDWEEDEIMAENGEMKKVCLGEIDVVDGKHPFQLFVKEKKKHEMMTNARWPNALWTDRHPETNIPNVFYNDYWRKADNTEEMETPGRMADRKDVDGKSLLALSNLNMEGAMAILNIGSFHTWHRQITSHNEGDAFFLFDDHDIKHTAGDKHEDIGKDQFYIDSKENLLDTPGEWVYNKTTQMLKFMPLNGVCPDSSSDAVKGRVMDYAITIKEGSDITIKNLDFFASNMMSSDDHSVYGIYLDSLNFNYPVASHRMLQDDSIPKTTNIQVFKGGPIEITNCVFFGGEGTALVYGCRRCNEEDQGNVKITNNLFKWNDWSCVMDGSGMGAVVNKGGGGEHVIGNTWEYNAASVGIRPGLTSTIKENRITGTRRGNIMSDGSSIHYMTNRANDSVVARNWVFDSPVSGVRVDGGGYKLGFKLQLLENVIRHVGGYMMKGDYHNVTGNLALDCNEEGAGLKLPHIRKNVGPITNLNSIVENNACMYANGDLHSCEKDANGKKVPRAMYPVEGIKSNNYYGNYSWACGEEYDGSVVRDGATLNGASPLDFLDLFVDVDNHDFRPKPNTELTSSETQIGPYPSQWSTGDRYVIPGRREGKASYPIPSHRAKVQARDALMFQPAFRCTEENDKHLVYIAKNKKDMPPKDKPTATLSGEGNVVVFDDIDFSIEKGDYYWRVDCVKGDTNKRTSGNTWKFTIAG